jgi:hypothetical protein
LIAFIGAVIYYPLWIRRKNRQTSSHHYH